MDNSKEVYRVPTRGTSPPPNDEGSKGIERDALLQYISEMLMEEEEDEELGNLLHDSLALQATEKSLHDALHNINQTTDNSGLDKNNRSREDMSEHDRRSHKQLANNNAYEDDESVPLEMYDDVLLCPSSDRKVSLRNEQSKVGTNLRSGRGKKNDHIINLSSLLMQCVEAMTKVDNKTINELLQEIKHHSSPKGNGMERLAHYFADALEARLSGTGTHLCAALDSKRVTMAAILRSYRMFFTACPFRKMTKILTNRTIDTLDSRATTLHIIDFGILYGFQWPDLIYALSERPGGPPKLRITGIDFPQPGFRPAERVAATGRRLAKWADRFGVPFEFNAIAKKWETITLGDLRIEKNHELVVVNCMYRLQNVPDEMETGCESPRDDVLNLIKKINPEMFIHGVANGTYDTPFFITRFREAFFYFSSMFDMFDATMPRNDENRLLFEEHIFGKEVMNIIACEGAERVERPETYKQCQARTVSAGFRQVAIDRGIVKRLKKVKTGYHESFSVEEEGKWILLGWKGRVIKAFSCWRPTHNPSSS